MEFFKISDQQSFESIDVKPTDMEGWEGVYVCVCMCITTS